MTGQNRNGKKYRRAQVKFVFGERITAKKVKEKYRSGSDRKNDNEETDRKGREV